MPNAVRQLFEVSKRQTEEHLRRLGVKPLEENASVPKTSIESIKTTVEDDLTSTVEDDPTSTVGINDLWRAEGANGVFTSSRIVRITEAQQSMTHVEEAVYDVLWGGAKKKGEVELFRLSQMGYGELSEKARTTKRTIQNIINRLIDKHIIAIETEADILHRKSTVYRVFSYASIRKYQRESGRNWIVRTGRGGVFYAQKLAPTTVEVRAPSTVESRAPSTVESRAPPKEGSLASGSLASDTSSSSGSVVAQALSRYGPDDDDAVCRLIQGCQAADRDATENEIAHFIGVKGEQFRNKPNVGNMIGLLIRSVPRCFESAMLFQYRSAKQREHAEAVEVARKILDDPASSLHDREWALDVAREGKR